MGPPRHLAMVPASAAQRIKWPVPFSDGFDILNGLSGKNVVVLVSGDPFWFGAGSVIARQFDRSEWTALPAPSCFALAAAHMGWALERTTCIGLHAAPFTRLRRDLAKGVQFIATVRDGEAVRDLAAYLTSTGCGQSQLTVMEHLGGPEERITSGTAETISGTYEHPVCIAIEISGDIPALSVASGLPDDTFDHDGQITKRPMRAITLSTLAPLPGEHLWDIGGGSGSIGLEWLLAHPTTSATSIEPRADRAQRIRSNAAALGVEHRMTVVEGSAPAALAGLNPPDAIFVGGGLSKDVLQTVTDTLTARIVVNAVTLEGEALLARYHAELGGTLMRVDLSNATPLGSKRGWSASYPVVQWRLTR